MYNLSMTFLKAVYASIHNEIHRQIGEIKRQGGEPCQIFLGKKASRCFWVESWFSWPAHYLGLPITYFYNKIIGVWVKH